MVIMEYLGKHIGKAIVKLREERNMSAKDLAESTKKSQSYISKLETGNVRNPRKETMKEILVGMDLSENEIENILTGFYNENEDKKNEKILFLKKSPQNPQISESNVDFIQNPMVLKSNEISEKQEIENYENEEIIFQFSNRHELSLELTAIAHQLQETANSLINRNMIDVRYDGIKSAVNQASDRLEFFKLNYGMYVEKLIRDGNKIQV